MGKSHPVVIRKLVDGDQHIFPLRHTGQHGVAAPPSGPVGFVFTYHGGMVAEHHGLGTHRGLPDMLLAALLTWAVILHGAEHVIARFVGDQVGVRRTGMAFLTPNFLGLDRWRYPRCAAGIHNLSKPG